MRLFLLLVLMAVPSFGASIFAPFNDRVSNLSGIASDWLFTEASGNPSSSVGAARPCVATALSYHQTSILPLSFSMGWDGMSSICSVSVANSSPFNFEWSDPFWVALVTNPSINRTASQFYPELVGNVDASPRGWILGIQTNNSGNATFVSPGLYSSGSDRATGVGDVDISSNVSHLIVENSDGTGTATGMLVYVNNILNTLSGGAAGPVSGTMKNTSSLTMGQQNGLFGVTWYPGLFDNMAIGSGNISAANRARLWQAFPFWQQFLTCSRNTAPWTLSDDDMASDIGGVHAAKTDLILHQLGCINLVAFTDVDFFDSGANYAATFLKWSGFAALPFGAATGTWCGGCATNFNAANVVSHYALVSGTNTRASYTAGYLVMRQQLVNAGAAGKKITLVATGGGRNIANLLASGADAISPLTGLQLVTANALELDWSGGYYPSSTVGACTAAPGVGPEFNFCSDPANANYVALNWPSAVPLNYINTTTGDTVSCAGQGYLDIFPLDEIVHYTFSQASGNNAGFNAPGCSPLVNLSTSGVRPIWDELTVLFSVNHAILTKVGNNGTNVIDPVTGANVYTAATGGNQQYYSLGTSVIGTDLSGLASNLLLLNVRSGAKPF